MKLKPSRFLLLLLAGFPSAFFAQTLPGIVSTVPTSGKVPLPSTYQVVPPIDTKVQITINAHWNDAQVNNLTVPISNDTDKVMHVAGVQTTSSLFVADFPKVIPPHAKGDLALILRAAPNTSSDTETVRLLTDDGEVSLCVLVQREKGIAFDTPSLQWTVGESAAAKSVGFIVAPGVGVPKQVHALGHGNNASLVSLGSNRYRIDITPAATDKAAEFPVVVEFDQPLPGASPVVMCSVQQK